MNRGEIIREQKIKAAALTPVCGRPTKTRFLDVRWSPLP